MTSAATLSRAPAAAGDLQASVRRLAENAGRYAAQRLTDVLSRAQHAVDVDEEPAGMPEGAAVGAVRTAGTGRSPAWGAVRGAWSAADNSTRAAVVGVLLLLVVLSPVLLVLVLLAALVAAVVVAARRTSSR